MFQRLMLIAVISYVYNHRSRIIILEIKHRINENEKRKEMIEKICWRIEKETTRKEKEEESLMNVSSLS